MKTGNLTKRLSRLNITLLCLPVCSGFSVTGNRLAILAFVYGLYGKDAPSYYLHSLCDYLGVSFKTVQDYLSRERAKGLIDYRYCTRTSTYKNLRIKPPIAGKLYVTPGDLIASGGNWLKAAYLNALQYGLDNGFTAKKALGRLKGLLHRNTLLKLRADIEAGHADLFKYATSKGCTYLSIAAENDCTYLSTASENKCTYLSTIKNDDLNKPIDDLNKPTAKAAAQAVLKAANSEYQSETDNAAYTELFKYFRALGCSTGQTKRIAKIFRRGDGVRWGFRGNGYDTCPSLVDVLAEFDDCVQYETATGNLDRSVLSALVRVLEGRIVSHQRLNRRVLAA